MNTVKNESLSSRVHATKSIEYGNISVQLRYVNNKTIIVRAFRRPKHTFLRNLNFNMTKLFRKLTGKLPATNYNFTTSARTGGGGTHGNSASKLAFFFLKN